MHDDLEFGVREIHITQEIFDAVDAEFPVDRPADKCSFPGCKAMHRASRSDVVYARAMQAAMPEGEAISSHWRDDGWCYFLNWPGFDDGFYCPVHAEAMEKAEAAGPQ
jgi:hypothetical protein